MLSINVFIQGKHTDQKLAKVPYHHYLYFYLFSYYPLLCFQNMSTTKSIIGLASAVTAVPLDYDHAQLTKPSSPDGFQKCVINVAEPGADIADNYQNYPDPCAFYINDAHPGVTLWGQEWCKGCPGWTKPDRTNSSRVVINTGKGGVVWNEKQEQCILNGGG